MPKEQLTDLETALSHENSRDIESSNNDSALRVNRISLSERRAFQNSESKQYSELSSFSSRLVGIRNLIRTTLENDLLRFSRDIQDLRNRLDDSDRCDFDSKCFCML